MGGRCSIDAACAHAHRACTHAHVSAGAAQHLPRGPEGVRGRGAAGLARCVFGPVCPLPQARTHTPPSRPLCDCNPSCLHFQNPGASLCARVMSHTHHDVRAAPCYLLMRHLTCRHSALRHQWRQGGLPALPAPAGARRQGQRRPQQLRDRRAPAHGAWQPVLLHQVGRCGCQSRARGGQITHSTCICICGCAHT